MDARDHPEAARAQGRHHRNFGRDRQQRVAALCVRASDRNACLALMLPETESSDDNVTPRPAPRRATSGSRRSRETSRRCWRRQGATGGATRRSARLIPEYRPDWKSKIVLPSVVDSDSYRLFSVVVAGARRDADEGAADAATRTSASSPRPTSSSAARKMIEYYHADRLNYAVDRHAEPARVRPGVLREERRRGRRRQADRAPLQDAGLRAGASISAFPRRSATGRRRRTRTRCRRRRRSSTSRCPTTRWTSVSTRRTTASRPPRSRPRSA